jgi:hypothetical protein
MLTTFTAGVLLAALSASAGDQAPAKPEPPAVKLLRVAEGGALTFEVTNPNAAPLPYVGYLPESFDGGLKAGTIAPLYKLELLRDKAWKPHEMGWCGTGRGPVTLPAKGKVTFEVPPPGGEWEEFRVGLTWFGTAERKDPAVAWSKAVSRKDATPPKKP